jgi:hypothetical protein
VLPAVRTDDLQTVALETLVRMKRNAFRRKDQVHFLDRISLEMIDATWLDRFPSALRERLQQLLDDPDGSRLPSGRGGPGRQVAYANDATVFITVDDRRIGRPITLPQP